MTKRLLLFIAIIAIGRFANSNNSKIPINGIATESRRLDPDYGPPIRDNLHLDPAPNGPPVLDPHSNPSDNEEINRVRRNADSNSPILAPSTIISHLINGIHLQSGLMDESIPVEALVGELLNFGSVNVSEVVKFKPDGIAALTAQLKSAQTAVKLVSSSFDLEERAIAFHKIRSAYMSMVFENFPITKQPFTDIATFDATISNEWDEMHSQLNILNDDLKTLQGLSPKSNEPSKQVLMDLKVKSIIVQIQQMPDYCANLEKAAKKFNEQTVFFNSFKVLKPMAALVYLIDNKGSNLLPVSHDNLKDNVKKILELRTALLASKRDIEIILELTRSRVHSESKITKYTDAFPSGISDLEKLSRDVRDPWLAQMMNATGMKFNNLVDGFQPLFKVNDHFRRIDDVLKPVLTADLYQSLLQFDFPRLLQSLMKDDATDPDKVLLSFTGYIDTTNTAYGTRNMPNRVNMSMFMRDVKKLDNHINKVKMALKVDFGDMRKVMNSFNTSVLSIKDMKTLGERIMMTDDLKNLMHRVDNAEKLFEGLDSSDIVKSLKSKLNYINDDDVKVLRKDEEDTQDGFKQRTYNDEILWNAIHLVQTLRNGDSRMLENLNHAAEGISQISNSLIDIKSVAESMKTDVKGITVALNKLPNSASQSVIVGRSARSLEYAEKLLGFESSIAQLGFAGLLADVEMRKIENPVDLDTVAVQWEDHVMHVQQLANSVETIKDFNRRISDYSLKNIEDYGSPLKDLVKLSDAKISLTDKLTALDTLIKTADSDAKSELEEAKKTLVALSNLDLEFSKHKTQFEGAPKAFQDFQVFLTEFISTDHNAKEDGATTVPLWVFIVSVTVFIIVVIGILVAAHFIRKKMMNDKVLAFFLSIKNADYDYSKEYGIKLLGDYEETGSVKADRINDWSAFVGDKIKCPDGTVMFPSNFDMPGEFWRIVVEADTEVIIMLCKGIETSKFRRFFKTERGVGDISFDGKVTTLSESHESGYKNAQYEILVKRRGIEWPEKKVKVLFCPSYKTKPEHAEAYELMKKVLKMKMTKKPILVHSMEGMDEPMAFIGFHYCSEIVKRKRITFEPLYEELVAVSNKRRLITRPPLVYWLLLGIMYFLAQKNKDYMKMYQEQLQRFLDKWIREDGRWVAGCDESVEEVEEEEGNEEIETDQEELD